MVADLLSHPQIDWGRLMSMTNFGTVLSAKSQVSKVRKEVNDMLAAKGLGPNVGWYV